MIILISGNGCTGKTLMAQTLLEKYRIPYFSIDHLKMGIFKSDKNCGFTPDDSDELIGGKLWPIVRNMITTVIENNQNMIVEGCYILPHYLKDFKKSYSDQIISVFIGFSERYVRKNFDKIIGYRSVIESRGYSEERTADELIREHDVFRKKCLESGVDYFVVDRDYEQDIGKVYEYIDKKAGEISADKQT